MASNTLFQLTYETARALKQTYDGIATGGGVTSIVDTTYRTEGDDVWNKGSVWILYDAGGAGAAPQGEWAVCSDFSSSSDTLTISTVSAAVAAGDRYAVAKKRYPLSDLIGAVNEALSDLGPIEITDTTTVDLIAATKEYSLPDVPNCELKEVWIQGQTGLTGDNAYFPVYDWYVLKSATGTANKVVFKDSYPIDRSVRLVYTGLHSTLSTYNSEIDDSINHRLIYNQAAINLLERRILKIGDDDGTMTNLLNDLKMRLQEAKQDTPKKRLSKKPHYLITGVPVEVDRFKTIEEL
jgi:hypothetical protein